MARKTLKFRLYPHRQQREKLQATLDLCRELYNAGLQERIGAWKNRTPVKKQLSERWHCCDWRSHHPSRACGGRGNLRAWTTPSSGNETRSKGKRCLRSLRLKPEEWSQRSVFLIEQLSDISWGMLSGGE